MASFLTGAMGRHQRHDAQDEGERSHENGAQTNPGCFHGCFHQRKPALPQLLGEFDDQNRILAGQSDQHDQPNLAVDIVLQTAQGLRAERSQQRHGHREQHDEGQHEAFILRRER